MPDNLLLEADESSFALSIEQRHVDPEDADQRVGHVFFSCGFSVRSPRHTFGD